MLSTSENATVDLIAADVWRMDCLQLAQSARLPDWLIAAGFVRNLVWDHLHERLPRTGLNDVDLVFFDAANQSPDIEREIEAGLAKMRPGIRWQVRNQARMHVRNGHAPYQDTWEAISVYPELETCVGARLDQDGVPVVVAPHGILRNWALTIQVNPNSGYARRIAQQRITEKRWLETWPRLRLVD